jgi:hypothetical protein
MTRSTAARSWLEKLSPHRPGCADRQELVGTALSGGQRLKGGIGDDLPQRLVGTIQLQPAAQVAKVVQRIGA